MGRLVYGLPYWVVVLKLDKLNNTRRLFEEATDEDIKRKADVEFADCYDWLIAHDVLIYYDKKPKLWVLRFPFCL